MAGAPVEVVQQVPLFAELRPDALEQVARLFKKRRFAQGETVTKEGSGGAAFFLIESGDAAVTVKGKPRPALTAGDHFGEIALIDEGPRMAEVIAESDVETYVLASWQFRPFVQDHPDVAWALMQSLVQRIVRDNESGEGL
jgi:CRP/FNR family cyclic AMP-dependent transcriptional regulator